jgi:hypothetical protein
VTTAKPSTRYGAMGERAGGRLCSTELHHHWGHDPRIYHELMGWGPWKPEPGWLERSFTDGQSREQEAYLLVRERMEGERQP